MTLKIKLSKLTKLKIPNPKSAHGKAPILIGKPGTAKRMIYDALAALGKRGATCDELASILGELVWPIRPHVSILFRDGIVVFSGDRRLSPAKRQNKVWVVAKFLSQKEGSTDA